MRGWGMVFTGLLLSVVLVSAQSQSYIQPNQGQPGIPFRSIATDTPKCFDTSRVVGGIKDTTILLNLHKVVWLNIYAQGNNGIRYCDGGIMPTRYHQIAVPCSNGVGVQDSGARGTAILMNVATNTFLDSMYVQFKGTTFDDTLWLIVKKYTNKILINKPYKAYTTNSDSVMTPNFGLRLYSGSNLTRFGNDWIKQFRFENWSATSPCTLTNDVGRTK